MFLTIDVGGTFTDIVAYNERSRELSAFKVLTDPVQLEKPILDAINRFKIDIRNTDVIINATTIASNALIEGKTAKTGLLTTKGFKGILEIGREDWFEYDWSWQPKSLVRPNHIKDVEERTDTWGNILTPLNEDNVRKVANVLKQEKVEVIAISFLNSFVNPTNENRAREVAVSIYAPEDVCTSSEILQQWGEYERTNTTVVNASLIPLVRRYASILPKLQELGFRGNLLMFTQDGGSIPLRSATKHPFRIIESGPAAGVIYTAHMSRLLGHRNFISFDMGGTTTKVGLVVDGHPTLQREFLAAGYMVRAPSIDLTEIGTGGGTICSIDGFGRLHLGPQSTGSVPGPACYGRGGKEATITDANMVLGFLSPKEPFGGEIMPNHDLAYQVMKQKIAEPLNMEVHQAAEAIFRIANNDMSEATRIATIYKGYDARKIPLFSYGGASPVHTPFIMKMLQIPFVIVPRYPGVGAAMGLLVSDMMYDDVRTLLGREDNVDFQKINNVFEELEQKGIDMLKSADEPDAKVETVRQADMRFVGQTHEITVPWGGKSDGGKAFATFRKLYAQSYETPELQMKGMRGQGLYDLVEIVNLRVRCVRKLSKPSLKPTLSDARKKSSRAQKGEREVYIDGKFHAAAIYSRELLVPGSRMKGPAVIEQFDSTVLIPTGMKGRIDEYLNLKISRS